MRYVLQGGCAVVAVGPFVKSSLSFLSGLRLRCTRRPQLKLDQAGSEEREGEGGSG